MELNDKEVQAAIQAERDEMRRIMAVKRFSEIGLANIWFKNDAHRENFLQLVTKFKAQKSPEYASACYVCSHPEIFHRVNWKNTMDNPFDWYWGEWIGKDDDDENGYHEESKTVGELSSSYRSLVRAGVELFTGSQHHFNLMALIGNAGDEVYRLFVQMLEIRRDRALIQIEE